MPRRHVYLNRAPGGPYNLRSPSIFERTRDAVADTFFDWSSAVGEFFSPAFEPESDEPYPGQKENMGVPRLIFAPVRPEDKIDYREVTYYLMYYEPGFSEKLQDAKREGQTKVHKLLNEYGFVWLYDTTYELDRGARDMLMARKSGLRKPIPRSSVVEHYDN